MSGGSGSGEAGFGGNRDGGGDRRLARTVNDATGRQITVDVPGELKVVPFHATAGTRVTLAINSLASYADSIHYCAVPPGEVPSRAACTQPGTFDVDINTTGTWNLVAYAYGPTPGTVLVWGSTPTTDPNPLVLNDPAGRVEAPLVPGRIRNLTFLGTAGQVVTLARDGNFTGSDELHDPSGATIATYLNQTLTLPATGTYTIVMRAGPYTNIGSYHWYLSAPKVAPNHLAFEDPAGWSTMIDVPHQQVVVPFDANAQQFSTLVVTPAPGSAVSPMSYLVSPDGSGSSGFGTGAANPYRDFNTPTTDTYRWVVFDSGAATGAFTVRLTRLAPATALTVNGPPITTSFTMPWAQKQFTFTLPSPAPHLTIHQSNANLQLDIVGPNGPPNGSGGDYFNLAAGTYTLLYRSTSSTTTPVPLALSVTTP